MAMRQRKVLGSSAVLSIALALGIGGGACSTYQAPVQHAPRTGDGWDPQITQFYQQYLRSADPNDPGEAAYAIKVGEQWLASENLANARHFFENARQLLEHEKLYFEGRQRRDPEGYHQGRAELEAALLVVLSRLIDIHPNALYTGQFEVEGALFNSDRRALEDLLAAVPLSPSDQ